MYVYVYIRVNLLSVSDFNPVYCYFSILIQKNWTQKTTKLKK